MMRAPLIVLLALAAISFVLCGAWLYRAIAPPPTRLPPEVVAHVSPAPADYAPTGAGFSVQFPVDVAPTAQAWDSRHGDADSASRDAADGCSYVCRSHAVEQALTGAETANHYLQGCRDFFAELAMCR